VGEEQEGEEKEVEEEEEDEGGDGVAGRGYDSDANIVGKKEDSNDIEATEIRHGHSFAASFYLKSGALGKILMLKKTGKKKPLFNHI
jgi:hypothetical protein